MIFSSVWEVWNAVISARLISIFIIEVFRVPLLFQYFLLLQSFAFFLPLGQFWIIFRKPGLFLILIHSSLENNLVLSEISTPFHDLVSPNLSFLTFDTFLVMVMIVLLDRLLYWEDEAYLCVKVVCCSAVVPIMTGPLEIECRFQILIHRTDLL